LRNLTSRPVFGVKLTRKITELWAKFPTQQNREFHLNIRELQLSEQGLVLHRTNTSLLRIGAVSGGIASVHRTAGFRWRRSGSKAPDSLFAGHLAPRRKAGRGAIAAPERGACSLRTHLICRVMDVLGVTDFPDIRCKWGIQSAHEGSILIIPREGGYLFRLYVELALLEIGERVASRNITLGELIAKAQRIRHPYKLEISRSTGGRFMRSGND
jgi:hypothetical protein